MTNKQLQILADIAGVALWQAPASAPDVEPQLFYGPKRSRSQWAPHRNGEDAFMVLNGLVFRRSARVSIAYANGGFGGFTGFKCWSCEIVPVCVLPTVMAYGDTLPEAICCAALAWREGLDKVLNKVARESKTE